MRVRVTVNLPVPVFSLRYSAYFEHWRDISEAIIHTLLHMHNFRCITDNKEHLIEPHLATYKRIQAVLETVHTRSQYITRVSAFYERGG